MVKSPICLVNIDHLPINIAIYRIKDGDVYIVDFNLAALATEKTDKNSVIGKRLLDVFPKAKKFGLFAMILDVFETGEIQELDLNFYQDARISGWKKNRVIKLPNGNVMAVYDDLTKQKQLESELIKEKKLLEDAQKLAHLGSWEWNIADNSLFWSDEVFRIFGEIPQSFTPTYQKFSSYIPKDEIPILESAISYSLTTKQRLNNIHRIIRSNGQMRFVQETGIPFYDEAGAPLYMIGSVYDITETHNFKMELEKTTTELQTIFELNPHITFITYGKNILSVNRRFLKFSGCKTLHQFKAKHQCFGELFTSREGYLNPVESGANWVSQVANNPDQLHKVLIAKSDNEYTFLAHAARYTLDNNHKYIVVLEDVSELERYAQTDYLTQLYMRHKIHDILQLNFDNFQRYGLPFSVILLDIDYFKKVNDTFGHLVGDSVLKKIAAILKDGTRCTDTVGRWGGEEFIIICPNSDIEDAYKLSEKLRTSVETCEFKHAGNNTVSLGINCIQTGMSIEQLINSADLALYYAKNSTRNQSVKYHSNLPEIQASSSSQD